MRQLPNQLPDELSEFSLFDSVFFCTYHNTSKKKRKEQYYLETTKPLPLYLLPGPEMGGCQKKGLPAWSSSYLIYGRVAEPK